MLPLEKAQLAPMRPQGTGKLSAELSGEKLQGKGKSVTELLLGRAAELPDPSAGRGAEAAHVFTVEHLAQLSAVLEAADSHSERGRMAARHS